MASHLAVFTLFLSATLAYSYDRETAVRATMYSSVAYSDPKNIDSWDGFASSDCSTFAPGFVVNRTYTNDGNQGYVGVDHHNRQVVLAFRGSSNILNWIENLDTGLRYKDECVINGVSLGNAHYGFCGYVRSLAHEGILEAAHDIHTQNPGYQMFVVGHSLGAAAAAISANYLGIAYPGTNPLVYTMGEPRAGDHTFVSKFEKAGGVSFRIAHRDDPVPHVSLCCADCSTDDYCPYHQGREVYFQEDMSLGHLLWSARRGRIPTVIAEVSRVSLTT